MYKPNFCAECGERVARTRWRLWTNRRFCALCEKRFGRSRILWTLLAVVVLLGSGFVAGRAGRPKPPPLLVERGEQSALVLPSNFARQTADNNAQPAPLSSSTPAATQRFGPDGTPDERPTDPQETVSICGARTKKGKPCSRRVRGTGRCWQHRGLPAMLPPSKLIVQG